jgi:hypothetical protein
LVWQWKNVQMGCMQRLSMMANEFRWTASKCITVCCIGDCFFVWKIHKKGNQYSFFSRTLKPVLKHKVEHVKDYLPQACPHGNSIILDSEVISITAMETSCGWEIFSTSGVACWY